MGAEERARAQRAVKVVRFEFPDGEQGNVWCWVVQQVIFQRGGIVPDQRGNLPPMSGAEKRTFKRILGEFKRISQPNPDPRIAQGHVDGMPDLRARVLRDDVPRVLELIEDDFKELIKITESMQWVSAGYVDVAIDVEDALKDALRESQAVDTPENQSV